MLINGLNLYNARLNAKSDAEGIPDVTEFNKSRTRGLSCRIKFSVDRPASALMTASIVNGPPGLAGQFDGEWRDELPDVQCDQNQGVSITKGCPIDAAGGLPVHWR